MPNLSQSSTPTHPGIHPRLHRTEKRPRRAGRPRTVTRGIDRSNLVFVATSKPRANYTRFREMTKAIFLVFGKCVREITSREETERPPENRLARSQHAPASQEPKARWRSGSADRTAPEQVWQAPGLREFRLAESQQILPLT